MLMTVMKMLVIIDGDKSGDAADGDERADEGAGAGDVNNDGVKDGDRDYNDCDIIKHVNNKSPYAQLTWD